jgi:hypothetical protein
MPQSGIDRLRSLRRRYARSLVIEPVRLEETDWHYRDGVLSHRRAEYFSLVGRRQPDGREAVLFEQSETALIGLLCARVDGRDHVLLSARVEPGLPNACQITSTVQSTPSNYRRRHGGRATPHLDLLLDPPPDARVLHDSRQYDWGDYYTGKVKRFLIVELAEPVAAAPPHEWVPVDRLPDLLDEDYGVTSDLRVAALLLSLTRAGALPSGAPPEPLDAPAATEVPLEELRNWRVGPDGISEIHPDQGAEIGFFRTRAQAREVEAWAQPLMAVAERLDLVLPVDGPLIGVRPATGAGLDGVRLWHPASLRPEAADAHRHARVPTSAEGGRFLHHHLDLSLASAGPGDVEDDTLWVTREQVAGWVLTDEATSLELRMTLSLLLRAGLAP